MKKITDYINESNVDIDLNQDSYHPKTKKELQYLLKKLPWSEYSKIDTSKIKSFAYLFTNSVNFYKADRIKDEISNWDTSNVISMEGCFYGSRFKGDISKWNTSKVKNMSWMFSNSNFNGDISDWDVSNVENMDFMFFRGDFNKDISEWTPKKMKTCFKAFDNSPLENNPPKWYKN